MAPLASPVVVSEAGWWLEGAGETGEACGATALSRLSDDDEADADPCSGSGSGTFCATATAATGVSLSWLTTGASECA